MSPINKRKYISLIFMYALMLMIGILSSDIYLPSMPHMQQYFVANYSTIQYTLTFFLLFLSFFQFLLGPLSDRIKNEKMLCVGTALYCISSFFIVFSCSISMLYFLRSIQAIGASFILVLARKMITGLYPKNESQGFYTIILPIVSLCPAAAPVIGGLLETNFGWRSCFLFLTASGILIQILCINTLKRVTQKAVLQKKVSILGSYYNLLSIRNFSIFSLSVGLSYFIWFSYLSVSPFLYSSYMLSSTQIGFCYMSQSIFAVFGVIIAKKIVNKRSIKFIFGISAINAIICSLLITTINTPKLITFIILMTQLAQSTGILITFGISAAMNTTAKQYKSLTGTASGLVGSIQILGGMLGTVTMSFFSPTAHALGGVLLGASLLISILSFCIDA